MVIEIIDDPLTIIEENRRSVHIPRKQQKKRHALYEGMLPYSYRTSNAVATVRYRFALCRLANYWRLGDIVALAMGQVSNGA